MLIVYVVLNGGHEWWYVCTDPKVGALTLFDDTVPAAPGYTKDNVISWDASFRVVAAV
jgi:hypothetical protein